MSQQMGIPMKKFVRAHEEYVQHAPMTESLLREHLEKIRFLQHERLVHLIVTVMVTMVELFVTDLVLLHPETHPLSALIMLGLAVLLGFYYYHYFVLENAVQRWYKIAERLMRELEGKHPDT